MASTSTSPEPAPASGTRARILAHVEAHPGTCIADVAADTDVSHSTASYHLEKLAAMKHVVKLRDGNKARFFVNGGAFAEDERTALAVLENATTRDVLRLLLDADDDGTYRAEIAEELDLSTPTVSWHLDRLHRIDVVEEEPDGRNQTLRPRADRVHRLTTSLARKLGSTDAEVAPFRTLAAAAEA